MTHECDLKLCPDGAYCAWAGCHRRLSGDEVERRLNEYENLIATVAGMRDKWTPPDEVAQLEAEYETLKKARERLMRAWHECPEDSVPDALQDVFMEIEHTNILEGKDG